MSLQLILGNSGAGKTHALLTEILRQANENPAGRFLVIVPEQFTMQTQKELVTMQERHGILNIDVLSFERLAYRVFDEIGYADREILEEIGKSFILQKIALDEEKNLPYFGAKLKKSGSIAEMKSVISELTQYEVEPEILREIAGSRISPQLSAKLSDIAFIYKEFRAYLSGSGMTAEEVPGVLGDVADRSQMLKGAVFAFDGYTGFTPVQQKLLRRLLSLAGKIYVTVAFDDRKNPGEACREQDLFHMSSTMIHTLTSLAEAAGVPVEPPIRIRDEGKGRLALSPSLKFLEQNLFRSSGTAYKKESMDVRIFEAANPLKETAYAARMISSYVRTEGLRYRDFAVITGDLTSYGSLVRQIFTEEGIPFFIDEKRFLIRNVFVEYLRAALEACTDQYSYESIFRMLKTGMTDLTHEEIDRLENYVRAMGIRGKKKWRSTWTLHYRGEDPGEVPAVNAAGKKVTALLDPLAEALAKRSSTVREKTEALVRFCEDSRIQEKLKEREDDFTRRSRPDLAREYAQVYGKIMGLFDKLVHVLSDEKISMEDYRDILEAGFFEEKIGIIPPGTDEVLIGDMQRSRLTDVKVLFFVGVNEGLIPKAPPSGGILSDADRQVLLANRISLRPTAREEMYIQKFYLYLTLTKPSAKLFLTYSMADSQGGVIRPAYLMDAVRRLFPAIRIETEPIDPAERAERPKDGIALLADGLQGLKSQEPSDAWYELFAWYKANPAYADRIRILLAAAEARNPQDQIGAAAAKALYGTTLRNSASRLEKFSQCAFAHFAAYGLKLKEREEFAFTGMDRGNVIHRALELFAGRTEEAGRPWTSLSDDARDALVKQCVADASAEYNGQILKDSARNEYQTARMTRLLTTSVWAMQEQLKRGDFTPVKAEQSFLSDGLAATDFSLAGGGHLTLTGRIDRIDTCSADGRTYVKILDYKTGTMPFDVTAVYYGLQLQLVVYLNAAVEMLQKNGQTAEPAGIFYYEIKDPIEEYDPSETKEALRIRILRDLKASGIVSQDKTTLAHLDRTLTKDSPSSDVIPVAYKKDGTLTKASKAIEPEDFRLLSSFVSKKVCRIGNAILKGEAAAAPSDYRNRTACDFCPYRGICGFDPKIPGYVYRTLYPMEKEEVLEKMKDADELDS